MYKWRSKDASAILFILVFVAFFFADGAHVIGYPPRAVHQYRQSDCVAYTQNYFTRHTGLFSPSFYNLVSKDGRSVSEFPLLYYIAGNLYHVLGAHYWVLRGLTFFCYLLGLLFLFKITKFWIKDPVLQIFPIIILATTPYFYYYALNSLPNVPAISFSFVGLYYIIRYLQLGYFRYLVASTLFFVLSSLLKPTDGGLIWVAYAVFTSINFFQKKQKDKTEAYILMGAVVIATSLYAWYRYAVWYNTVNHNDLNLLGFYPIWDMKIRDIFYTIFRRMIDFWGSSYQYKYILWLLVIFLIVFVLRWRVLNYFLKVFTSLLIVGAVLYDIFWFKAFSDHDYYQLINVIPPVFIFITIAEYCERTLYQKINERTKYFISAALFLIMFVSIMHNRNVQHDRYTNPGFVYKSSAIYEMPPFFRKIGVEDTDKLIVLPESSPNICLAAFWHRGFTTELLHTDRDDINNFRQQGAKYLVITDSSYISNPQCKPYISKMIGQYKGIYIFDVR